VLSIFGISGLGRPAAWHDAVKITRTPLWEWVRGAAKLWRCRVPIGGTLAQARQLAGLTVAQVSDQTCIKQTVIRRIEGDDYSTCGGDFYARANIRSIARAVGADSGPLIAEYDARYRARDALSAVSLEELLATSAPAPRRRRPGPPAVAGLVAAGYASVRRRAGSSVARLRAVPAYRPPGRWLIRIVVAGLVVMLGFGMYARFSGTRHAAPAPPAAGNHAVAPPQAGPTSPHPAPTGTQAGAAPAPAPSTPAGKAPAGKAPPGLAPTTPSGKAPAPAPAGAHAAVAPAPAPAASSPAPAPGSAGGSGSGGGGTPQPAHHAVAGHRPLPEPVVRTEPAPGDGLPGHDHSRRHHHRHRGDAAHQAAGGSRLYLPDGRYYASPDHA